ncbi:MAG: hypothetical protein MR804_08035 [Limosilactobacillus reuteri]|jgi:hypothetical protein|nr:hypothetical protein [Limosilactobacillus reuteri]MCI6368831.1 hypothetical protein [Limosilactobacillus reuteri]MDY4729605.1 hypothetical protein [Lactobacillus amylovorus]
MPRIIKIHRKPVDNSRTRIPNSLFDRGLTLEALGLYGFLLSRKQIEFSLEEIKNRSSDPLKSNLEILDELEQHHLIMKASKALTWKVNRIEQV